MDITERKRIEDDQKHLLDKLSTKTKELEHIIYITSHDLRSPLVNIQGFTREMDNVLEQTRSIINTEDISPETRERLAMILEEEIPVINGG